MRRVLLKDPQKIMDKNKEIIATLGPSSLRRDIVKKMDSLGVDIFRINLSHVEINEFEAIIKKVKDWTDKPVCPDTEGAQLRTGNISGNYLHLKTGSTIRFGDSSAKEGEVLVPLNVANLGELLSVGDLLKIDFDSVIVQITMIKGHHIIARVIRGGTVSSNKGIGVDRQLALPRFTKKDISAFNISKKLGLDTFFLSFCSGGDDIIALRELFDYPISVISKIETNRALNNLSEICKESDGVVIDRGDLSRGIPLTKISFAQSYILDVTKKLDVPVYVATNLVESMVKKAEPNRAELNDIVQTLESGADGLVLAAESAVGLYPKECVRVISRLIKEVENKPTKIDLEYLLKPPSDDVIPPHGGNLVQQYIPHAKEHRVNKLPIIAVNELIESDVIMISNGTYSPLDRFMDHDELKSVLEKNELTDGTVWSMPILFQINKEVKRDSVNVEEIAIKSERTDRVFAIVKLKKIQKLKDINNIAKKWFGTDDEKHPGVKQFMKGGNYILSGKPFLIKGYKSVSVPNYDLSPFQTRNLFSHFGWSDIIGYHTRNVPHRGHEYIQRRALEQTQADGIFISPVTGKKRKGDFNADVIIRCFEKLIEGGFYNPFGVLIGSFNTYSRYSGPKEAIFTAICRKNMGCNYFIVGRDHTGVGNYYSSEVSRQIFDQFDIGMNVIFFEKISYDVELEIYTDDLQNQNLQGKRLELSGTLVRENLLNDEKIPEYLMRTSIANELIKMRKENPNQIFHE